MAKALQLPSLPAHEEIVSRTIEELGTSIAQALEELDCSRDVGCERKVSHIRRRNIDDVMQS